MTIEELIKKLETVYDDNRQNKEYAHEAADDLLLEYINNEKVTELFNALEKWYA